MSTTRERMRSNASRMRHELEEKIGDAATRLREAGEETLRSLDHAVDRVTHAIRRSPRGGGAPVPVRELMRTDVRTCMPDDALHEAARIMWERDCGVVPVVDRDGSARVVGMITDRDICMALYTSGGRMSELQVGGAMAREVRSCHPDDTVSDAEEIMRRAQVRRLPVVDEEGRLRGILSLADIAEAAAGLRETSAPIRADEVAAVLEDVCRPRNELVEREEGARPGAA